jgi:hypothetical protein
MTGAAFFSLKIMLSVTSDAVSPHRRGGNQPPAFEGRNKAHTRQPKQLAGKASNGYYP